MANQTKSLTVRLPQELYQASSEIAKHRKVSFNALVRESLRGLVKQQQYSRLYQAFGEVGEDAGESDVGFATEAQREVVSRGEQ